MKNTYYIQLRYLFHLLDVCVHPLPSSTPGSWRPPGSLAPHDIPRDLATAIQRIELPTSTPKKGETQEIDGMFELLDLYTFSHSKIR